MANPTFSNKLSKFKKCCITDEDKYVHIVMAIHYLYTLSFHFIPFADLSDPRNVPLGRLMGVLNLHSHQDAAPDSNKSSLPHLSRLAH
jgi:hypothetical protein